MLNEILDRLKSIPLDDEPKYSAPFTLGEAFEDTFKPLDKDELLKRTKSLSTDELREVVYDFLLSIPDDQAMGLVYKWSKSRYKSWTHFIEHLAIKGKLRDFHRQEVLGVRESFEDVFKPASDDELDKRDMDAPPFLRRMVNSVVHITDDLFYLVVRKAKILDIKKILDKEVGPGVEDGITSKYEMADGTKIELDNGLDREGSAFIRVQKKNIYD